MLKRPSGTLGIAQSISRIGPPVAHRESGSWLARRWRSGFVATVLKFVIVLAVSIGVALGVQTAHASAAPATVGAFSSGNWGWTSSINPPYTDQNSSHASVHHNPAGGNWATDLYAAATTEVKLHVSSDGALTFSWANATGSCGSSRRINVLVDSTPVGWIYVTHLSDAAATTNAPTNGMTLGKIANLTCNPGGTGKHMHVELKNEENNSCYIDIGNAGSPIAESADFGILGSPNTGAPQACEEEEEDPDTDQDGISDSQDQCPAIPGVAAYNGCPPPQISSSSVISIGGQPHSFYYDATSGNLRHGWWGGSAWSFEDFDGHTATNNRLNADVGRNPTALIIGGQPHIFCYNATDGNLRHAWWNNGTGSWSYETFDGHTNTSDRVDADAGRDVTLTIYNSQPHLFYYDATNGNLRHSWWAGSAWGFENLDGHTNTSYRVNADAGRYPSPVVGGYGTAASLHIYYYDATGGNLRHAWYANTTAAVQFEDFDGHTNTGYRVNADAGQYASAVLLNGQPNVAYYDATGGNLRHAWWNTGTTSWSFQDLDGAGGTNGRIDANVGSHVTALEYNDQMHMFYYDATNGNLRHNWWNGGWTMVAADGATGTEGNLDADLGQYTRAMETGSQLHTYYYEVTGGNLRHMWWNTPTSSSGVETFDGTTGSTGGLNADVR
jgi:hypothetical protein